MNMQQLRYSRTYNYSKLLYSIYIRSDTLFSMNHPKSNHLANVDRLYVSACFMEMNNDDGLTD